MQKPEHRLVKKKKIEVISDDVVSLPVVPLSVSRSYLINQQQEDPSLSELLSQLRPSSVQFRPRVFPTRGGAGKKMGASR